ncbi:MAG TPA: flagellar export chaperone FlgN, partial [Feifaniaceae bacterium]|nr:flagellar export chaperone FlgN [Feifaniaceae bacterium]
YIIKNVPDEERRELDRLRGRYQEVVRELSALNELNQGLLQTQLQYTSFCMDMLMQAKPVGGTYGSTGQANAEYQQGRRLIDQEA